MSGDAETVPDADAAAGDGDAVTRADEAADRVRRRAEAVRRRELDRALSRLTATGELTAEQRRVLEAASERLVDSLLGPVEARAERHDAGATYRRLFGDASDRS